VEDTPGNFFLLEYTVYAYDTGQRKTQSVLYGWRGSDQTMGTEDDMHSVVFEYDTTY
jgi:hypothetical protein